MNFRENIINRKSGVYHINLDKETQEHKNLIRKAINDKLTKLEEEDLFNKYDMKYLYYSSETYVFIGFIKK